MSKWGEIVFAASGGIGGSGFAPAAGGARECGAGELSGLYGVGSVMPKPGYGAGGPSPAHLGAKLH